MVPRRGTGTDGSPRSVISIPVLVQCCNIEEVVHVGVWVFATGFLYVFFFFSFIFYRFFIDFMSTVV